MMSILAQTGDASWQFWLMFIMIVLQLLLLPFSSIIGWTVRQILDRLKSGDKKFDQQAEKLTRVEERVESTSKTVDEVKKDLNAQRKEVTENTVEGQGMAKEMRVEMERHFVRKEDFRVYTDRSDAQHAEVMRTLREVERKVK